MRYLQNKYRDFSNINFIGQDLLYLHSQTNLIRYNIEQKRQIMNVSLPLELSNKGFQTFQTYVQYCEDTRVF